MKNTFLFVSDTHLGFDYPVRPRIVRRRRGYDAFRQFRDVLDYAVENSISHVLHGGDLFFRSKVPVLIIDKVYELLNEYAEKGLVFYIVPGNHERSVLPDSTFPLHGNINVFDEHKTYPVKLNDCNISVSGFPYQKNIENTFRDNLRKTNHKHYRNTFSVVLVHQAIAGTVVGVQNYMFRKGPEVIQHREIPADIDMLLSGHIHRQQASVINGVHVLLSGSTIKTSFAEMYERKGFYRITLRIDNRKIVPEMKFIELKTRKMHRIVLLPDDFNSCESVNNVLIKKINRLENDSIIQICFDKTISVDRFSDIDVQKIRDNCSSELNIEYQSRIWKRSRDEKDQNTKRNT